MGNKGGGKRISKKVIQYLQAYLHASNLNPKDRYTAEKMHEGLIELAQEGELSLEEIPEVKTIKGWIGRYSASSKKEMSERALEENVIFEESSIAQTNTKNITNTTHNELNGTRKRQKRS